MMKNKLFISLVMLSSLAIVSCKRKTVDEQFAEAARQETQQMCPRVIDSSTTLDSIVYDIPSRTEFFYYSFSEEMDDTTIFTPYFIEDVRENMIKSLRNEIKMKKMMDEGIYFAYIYRSASTGEELMNLLFTREDYTGPLHLRTFNNRIDGKWKDYTFKHCPEEQDECTTLTHIAFDSISQTLTYDFTLKGELDIEDFHEVYPDAKKELRKLLTDGIKENTMLEDERKEGVNFHIVYTSESTGRLVMQFDIKL